jgi:hypothetical protein
MAVQPGLKAKAIKLHPVNAEAKDTRDIVEKN